MQKNQELKSSACGIDILCSNAKKKSWSLYDTTKAHKRKKFVDDAHLL